MTNLNEVLVLALVLELIESSDSVREILEKNRFAVVKTFDDHDFREVINAERLTAKLGGFTPTQIRAIQIKNALKYLEDKAVYIPKDWGKYQAEDDPHSQYSRSQIKSLLTGDYSNLSDRASDCK
jgi:hypothetical protein